MLHTDGFQILGVTIHNLVTTATWSPRFVHARVYASIKQIRTCSQHIWTIFMVILRSQPILSTPATLVAKFNNNLSFIRSEHKVNDKIIVMCCQCVQLTLTSLKISHCIKYIENTREHFNCLISLAEYSGVCHNKRCYNERMLQRTLFINKVRMLLRTRRNAIGRRSTRVRMTCHAFPL